MPDDDPLGEFLATQAPDRRLGWARLAVLDRFDRNLFDFVMEPDELEFGLAVESPLVERLDGVDEAMFRLLPALRTPILHRYRDDAAQVITRTASMAAGHFRRLDTQDDDRHAAIEEIAYLALADADGAALRLAAFAVDQLRNGRPHVAERTAHAAMRGTALWAVPPPAWLRLSAVADLVSVLADGSSILSHRWLARLLADRITGYSAAEAALLELGGERTAKIRSTSGVDWGAAMAFLSHRQSVGKQRHDIAFIDDRTVSYRQAVTVWLTDDASQNIGGPTPVAIGVLPRRPGITIDAIEVLDGRNGLVPALGRRRTCELLGAAALVATALPEPGAFARRELTLPDLGNALSTLAMQVAGAIEEADSSATVLRAAEALVAQGLLAAAQAVNLGTWLADLREVMPVVALVDADRSPAQVLHFTTNLAVPPARGSRLSGRAEHPLQISGFASADQVVEVVTPRRMLPVAARTDSAAGPVSRTRTDVGGAQLFTGWTGATARHVGGAVARGELTLSLRYGLDLIGRLRTIAFALSAAVLAAVLLIADRADGLFFGVPDIVTLLFLVGGVFGAGEVLFRARREPALPRRPRARLAQPWRATTSAAGAAWLLIAAASTMEFFDQPRWPRLLLFGALGAAGATILVEMVQAGADRWAASRWLGHGRMVSRAAIQSSTSRDGADSTDATTTDLTDASRLIFERMTRDLFRPRPLRLRWASVSGVPAQFRPPITAGHAKAAEMFLRLPYKQLVLLGGPSSGKTSSAALIGLELLDRQRTEPTVPTPWYLPLSTWDNSDDDVYAWASRQLSADLKQMAVPDLVRRLESGRILLILDGLDELPEPVRRGFKYALDRAGSRLPYLLLCRFTQYLDREDTGALGSAAVIRLAPPDPADIAALIQESDPANADRWAPVVHAIAEQGDSPLARAMDTPLMVTLVRAAFTERSRHPEELLDVVRFSGPRDVQAFLSDIVLPLAYGRTDPGSPPVPVGRATRWLTRIAQSSGRSFVWWRLHDVADRRRNIVTAMLVRLLATGVALGVGAAVNLISGNSPVKVESLVVVAGPVAIFSVVLAVLMRDRIHDRLIYVLDSTWVWPIATVLVDTEPDADLRTVLRQAIAAAVVAGAWWFRFRARREPLEGADEVAPVRSVRRAARVALAAVPTWTVAAAVLVAIRLALGQAAGAAAVGSAVFAAGLLLDVATTPWGRFTIARVVAAAIGELPWRLMRFLADAERRGVLRHEGAVYQFRVAALQDELAEAHLPPPEPDPVLPVLSRSASARSHQPSEIINRYLFPTEKFRGEWSPHWVHLAPAGLIMVVVTLVAGYVGQVLARESPLLTPIPIVFWLAALALFAWRVIQWRTTRFVLTSARILFIEGVVTNAVTMTPLARVTDVKYTQTRLGRLFGYGTLEVESSAGDLIKVIKRLPRINEVYLRIVEEMYEPEAVSPPVHRDLP